MGRQRIGEYPLTKIVPVKIDRPSFYRLRRAQLEAKQRIDEGVRKQEDYEELATTLRETLDSYVQKLECFNHNGDSMKKQEKIINQTREKYEI